jgi:hypothetical protein
MVKTDTLAGCDVDLSFNIDLLETAIFIPNSLTPNGDDINDDFEIIVPKFEVLSHQIYNLWGDKLFLEYGPTFMWNGRTKDANAEPGVYISGSAPRSSWSNSTQSGSLMLVR